MTRVVVAGRTALLLAVGVCCTAALSEPTRRTIQLLLQHNADIEARDLERYTALHRAQEAGALPLMELLLQHGAETVPAAEDEGAVVRIQPFELGTQ